MSEKVKNEKAKNEKAKNEKVKNEKAKNEKVKNEKVKNEKVKNEKVKNEKRKNEMARLGIVPFLALWLVGHAGVWMLTLWLYEALDIGRYDDFQEALFVTLTPGLLTAVLQTLLIERGLKKSMRGWLPVSLIGWLASGFACYQYITSTWSSAENTNVILLSLFLPVALVQTVWLWRRVKAAWLWALAAVVSAVVFALPLNINPSNDATMYTVIGLAALLQGTVTGSVMRHLWLHEREKEKNEKAKNELADSDEETRLEQLHDTTDAEEQNYAIDELRQRQVKVSRS